MYFRVQKAFKNPGPAKVDLIPPNTRLSRLGAGPSVILGKTFLRLIRFKAPANFLFFRSTLWVLLYGEFHARLHDGVFDPFRILNFVACFAGMPHFMAFGVASLSISLRSVLPTLSTSNPNVKYPGSHDIL